MELTTILPEFLSLFSKRSLQKLGLCADESLFPNEPFQNMAFTRENLFGKRAP